MTTPELSLDDLMTLHVSWMFDDPGVYRAVLRSANDPDGPELGQDVPVAQLSSLHPLLPGTLDAMLTYQRENYSTPSVSGLRIAQTLALLNNEYVNFTDVDGWGRKLVKLRSIERYQDSVDMVLLHGSDITTLPATVEQQAIEFALTSHTTHRVVKIEELNRQYPGWEERWRIGQDIGLEAQELIPHVFYNTPLVPAPFTMPELNFE